MTLATAIYYAECFAGFSFSLQSIEYYFTANASKLNSMIRLIASLALLLHFAILPSELIILGTNLFLLYRYQGPYNGGSDCIGNLLLISLTATHCFHEIYYKELVTGYFAIQLIYSYFQSGYVKLANAEWRNGSALRDVFLVTAYPRTEAIREWGYHVRILCVMGWAIMLFEILFPLTLLSKTTLLIALCLGMLFHLANALLFGLKRFFWIWFSGYPLLIWFQERINS